MVADIVRDTTRGSRIAVACACLVLVACGGHSPTAPTTPAPAIACPSAPPVTSLDGTPQTVSYPSATVSGGQAPLTTTCTPASGSAFPVGQSTVTCTATDAKARSAVCTFTVVVLPPPMLDVTSFLAFGDSITWGEDGTNPSALAKHVEVQLAGETYPQDLEKELRARYVVQQPTVTNGGCPGEYLKDPTTVQRYETLASSGRYGSLLIMEGSNDVDLEDSVALAGAITNLQAILDDAKSRGMRPFVATVPPMVPPGFNNRAQGYFLVPTYDDMIRALAGTEGVPLVDVYNAFGSNASSLIGFDGLHPNAAGYQVIADTFYASIKTVLEIQSTAGIQGRRRPATSIDQCPPIS